MLWVAVNKHGLEMIFANKPHRSFLDGGSWFHLDKRFFPLPWGTIEKSIGRKLTWDDEPVEIYEIRGAQTDSPLSHLIAEHPGETMKISFIPDADTVSDGATAIAEIYTYEPKKNILRKIQ